MSLPALQKRLTDIVEEYNEKVANIENTIASYEQACTDLKTAATISGTWGNCRLNTETVHENMLNESLLKSAWLHVYKGLNIDTIAPVSDKKRFDRAMEDPAPFTFENLRATFGDYIADPFGNIIRGLAEVFSNLDPAYKSHDKVKIGVEGLPKRIILTNVTTFYGYGEERLKDVLNALAAYQRKDLVSYAEIKSIIKDGDALEKTRGVTLKTFKNGNGHLIFNHDTLLDINRALASYYGEVLADCHEDKPDQKQQSTAVSKDLQYYPTPMETVNRIVDDIYLEGEKVLEPSCGCGRFMDAIKKRGGKVFGIEFDPIRATEARNKGHKVLTANFLDVPPEPIYDRVIMNPPFYGKHYAKHVHHAMKFLKPDGILTSILPVTARYDHGLLDDLKGNWYDLPFGSFKESGTNINTTVLTVRKDKQ